MKKFKNSVLIPHKGEYLLILKNSEEKDATVGFIRFTELSEKGKTFLSQMLPNELGNAKGTVEQFTVSFPTNVVQKGDYWSPTNDQIKKLTIA